MKKTEDISVGDYVEQLIEVDRKKKIIHDLPNSQVRCLFFSLVVLSVMYIQSNAQILSVLIQPFLRNNY